MDFNIYGLQPIGYGLTVIKSLQTDCKKCLALGTDICGHCGTVTYMRRRTAKTAGPPTGDFLFQWTLYSGCYAQLRFLCTAH